MRLGRFEFTPSLFMSAVYALLLAVLLSLGSWQLQRAAEKKSMLANAASAASAPAIDVATLTNPDEAAVRYARVAIEGVYDQSRQFLWDNRVHKGQAGFEVITPVATSNGLVLVNRGWVAPGATRQELPEVTLPNDLQGKSLQISGLFSQPSKGLVGGPAFEMRADVSATNQWPVILQYFDYTAMESLLGDTLIKGVVQPQMVGNEQGNLPQSQTEGRGYYTANWQPAAAIGPLRHYSYAFQWFALATALTVLFIVYNTRRISE